METPAVPINAGDLGAVSKEFFSSLTLRRASKTELVEDRNSSTGGDFYIGTRRYRFTTSDKTDMCV